MQIVLNGLMLSSFYLLMGMGLSLVFGIMRIVNFAHGELFMVGAIVFWYLLVAFGIPYFLSLVIAMVVVFALGAGLYQAVFRHFRGNVVGGFIASLGLVFILQVLAVQVFGNRPRSVPTSFSGTLEVGGAILPVQRLVIVLVAAGLVLMLYLFLEKTRFGRALRAASQDAEAASLQGVNLNIVASLAMGLSAAFAAAGGGLMTYTYNVYPYMGGTVIWIAFIVVIVGGMGSIPGVLLAALLFGFADAIIPVLIDVRSVTLINLALMLLVLSLRPKGLLGRIAF